MFITFKNTKVQQGEPGLQQVSTRNAAPEQGRNTRPSCITCQQKKARCTGQNRDCDRCRSRGLACIFPLASQQKGRPGRQAQPAGNDDSSREEAPAGDLFYMDFNNMDMDMTEFTGDGAAYLDAMASATSNQRGGAWPPPGDDALAAMPQSMATMMGGVGSESGSDYSFPMAGMSQAAPHAPAATQPHDLSISTAAATESRISRQPSASASTHSVGGVHRPGFVSVHSTNSVHSAHLDHSAAAHRSTPQSGLPADNRPPSLLQVGATPPGTGPDSHRSSASQHPRSISSSGSPPTTSGGSSFSGSSSASACVCMQGTVRVVQQLDDDEFHITTLTLDQVLRLQKTIIAHCASTVGCAECRGPGDVQAMVAIICDRLAEMFECIHRRMEKLKRRLASALPLSMRHLALPSQPAPGDSSGGGQLFCSTTGGLANRADCSSGLFLPGLEALYSEQEQVHLIEVLLRLQMENFEALLNRIIQTRQAAVSHARLSKLHNILARLAKARADIEADLREVFQMVTTRPVGV